MEVPGSIKGSARDGQDREADRKRHLSWGRLSVPRHHEVSEAAFAQQWQSRSAREHGRPWCQRDRRAVLKGIIGCGERGSISHALHGSRPHHFAINRATKLLRCDLARPAMAPTFVQLLVHDQDHGRRMLAPGWPTDLNRGSWPVGPPNNQGPQTELRPLIASVRRWSRYLSGAASGRPQRQLTRAATLSVVGSTCLKSPESAPAGVKSLTSCELNS